MPLDQYTRRWKEVVLQPLTAGFENVNPNHVTLASGVFGVLSAYYASQGEYGWGLICWAFNRILDGLDGVVARAFQKSSDFGGYLDILVDFCIYSLIPWGFAISGDSTYRWNLVVFLNATYFVNAGGLFQLSAILEKRNLGAKKRKELTTVTMQPALIEGTETVIMYSLWFLFPEYVDTLFLAFGIGVVISIIQRLLWANDNLH